MRPLTRWAALGYAAGLAACSSTPTTAPSVLSADTFLSFVSSPGDFIGGGESRRYALADGRWLTAYESRQGIQHVSVSVSSVGVTPSWGWTLELASPVGLPLGLGTYDNALRWPFQAPNLPGLSFTGNGRGCTTLTGRFVILDIAVNSKDNSLDRLHATWEQHCEGDEAVLIGEVSIKMTGGP